MFTFSKYSLGTFNNTYSQTSQSLTIQLIAPFSLQFSPSIIPALWKGKEVLHISPTSPPLKELNDIFFLLFHIFNGVTRRTQQT